MWCVTGEFEGRRGRRREVFMFGVCSGGSLVDVTVVGPKGLCLGCRMSMIT